MLKLAPFLVSQGAIENSRLMRLTFRKGGSRLCRRAWESGDQEEHCSGAGPGEEPPARLQAGLALEACLYFLRNVEAVTCSTNDHKLFSCSIHDAPF